MLTYTIKRLFTLIPMLLFMSFLIYGGIELMPGDAIDFLVSPEALSQISQEDLARLRAHHGLDRPFLVRYAKWLSGVMRGDFGYSLASGVPISQIVFSRLPATLELSITALLFSTLLGSFLGVLSALKKGTIADEGLTVAGMIGISTPPFFFGLLAILTIFKLNIDWPVGGRMQPGREDLISRLRFLLLPSLVMGVSLTAGVMRYCRTSLLAVLNKDFIKTARSKGIPEWRVSLVHGLRVAMMPVIVLVGFRLPVLIGGSVVIETVFQWPGVGKTFVDAVLSQNMPLVMMIALFTVAMVLISSFFVDLMTALLDPRVQM